MEKFIGTLKCTGGGDAPEDLLGALDLVRKENKEDGDFYFSKTGFNLIFLVCDSPCHGTQYHDGL